MEYATLSNGVKMPMTGIGNKESWGKEALSYESEHTEYTVYISSGYYLIYNTVRMQCI